MGSVFPPQGSGAIPGDAMSLTPAERLIVQALILSDATPFDGADIAAILADTATINWADITGLVNDMGVFPTANYASLAIYVEDIRTRLIAILGLIDSGEVAGPFSYLDAGAEQDVYEDTSTTRRRIWFDVSNRNMTQTGTFRIYRKVNGANYDIYIVQAVVVGGGDERAWDREFTTNQHWKITYEEDVDEGANRDIPYNIITQVIE